MQHILALTSIRMRLALRNRVFIFFSVAMPLAFLFIYAVLFGRGDPNQVTYLLPAVLALTVMGSFWGLSVQLVMYREQGILRRFRLAPMGPSALLFSGVIANYVLTLPTLVIELILARYIWKVQSFGNLWGVFVFVSLGMIAFSSFGLIVASITNSIQETQMINNAIWLLFLFFSGATFPLVFFPGWLQRFSVFLPATHLVVGLQYVLIGAAPLRIVLAELVALAGGILISLFVSAKLFRWEPEEKVTRHAKLAAAAAIIPFVLLGLWENTRDTRRNQIRAIYEDVMKRGQPVQQPAAPAKDAPSPPRD
jgi:ABC-type multidrug transport system permease subunit